MSTTEKKQTVKGMFDHIAPRYDFLNHLLSFNIDHYWRRVLVRELAKEPVTHVLDLATGTGDQAIAIAKRVDAKVQGIDISEAMLEVGKQKIKKLRMEDRITLDPGDAEDIQFPDLSFEAATISFGVRNFASLSDGLNEIFRVLTKGGRIFVLEFSHPDGLILGPLYKLYSKTYLPWMGRKISGSGGAYNYLPSSIQSFPDGDAFMSKLKESGFTEISQRRLSGGIVTLYIGRKPA